jgi:hypothetical protein
MGGVVLLLEIYYVASQKSTMLNNAKATMMYHIMS